MKGLLVFLDIFFIIFHSCFTLFNVTGWAWRRSRPIHLITMSTTAFSWFIMGYFYGWGYCFCTDWHWRIRVLLGKNNSQYSFIRFLLEKIPGFRPDPFVIDI